MLLPAELKVCAPAASRRQLTRSLLLCAACVGMAGYLWMKYWVSTCNNLKNQAILMAIDCKP